MSINEITAKSILRKYKKIDSWFITRYGMNLYRGCLHNCAYCDGRAEKYDVEGEFGRDVAVKINAPELLERELDPSRKRKPFRKCFIMIGGGVGDAYQSVEKKYGLTRKTLELLLRFKLPVHILTKSVLVERDLELIQQINRESRSLVSMSFSSVNQKLSRIFEPGVPDPKKKLDLLKRFKDQGIACGMFLMPVIPFVTDTDELLEESVAAADEAGLDFLIFSGMTLKPGRQTDYFEKVLEKALPNIKDRCMALYANTNQWGNAEPAYYHHLHQRFQRISQKYKIALRIPLRFYGDLLDEDDRVVVMLEQMDYLLKLKGEKSPYGYGAYSISRLKQPLREFKGSLQRLKGIGPVTERIVREILHTGTCSYYQKLIG